MKESVLIIVNYQKVIPSFLKSHIEVACRMFDRVIYVSRKLQCKSDDMPKISNLEFYQVSKLDWIYSWIKLPILTFSKFSRNNIVAAYNRKRINISFVRNHLEYLVCSETLYPCLKSIIKNNRLTTVTILSSWLNVESLTVARLSEEFPEIVSSSLAHSFEVHPERNKSVETSFNLYKHTYLSNINFISNKIYLLYYEKVMSGGRIESSNITNFYLGTDRIFELNGTPKIDEFHLLSCSNMNKVKRLDLIVNALKQWRKGSLIWTHIGDGPEYKEIKRLSNEVMITNPLVKIYLIGKKSNIQVQKELSENFFDLFINVSEFEGIPVSIMEAQSYGIPVLATDVGGNCEIVKASNGLLVDKAISPIELCRVVEDYQTKDKDEKKNMRIHSLNNWSHKFQAEKNATSFFEFLLSLHKNNNI